MNRHPLPDYLNHMRQAAEEACRFVESLSTADFLTGKRTLDAFVVNLFVIGEAETKVLDGFVEFNETYPEVPWCSMRSCIVHGYFKLNLDVVVETVQKALLALLRQLSTGVIALPRRGDV